ncbi:MAG: cytochrome C oxidase subunit IV family protein [Dehalococcoidia bacterium]
MEHEERFPNYILVWVVLLLLTASSIAGTVLVREFAPFLTRGLVAFLFLIGSVKALLVAANFMNLRFENKLLWVLGITALVFVGFFIAGTIVDITVTEKR